jgi:pyrroloquinoline quinone biosynthesis protein E
VRDDLEELVGEGRRLGFYTNLITSGIGLTERAFARMKELGLDHIQLSFQDSTREMNDFLSSTKTFDLKARVARLIKQYDYPMVLNVVLHRFNLDHVDRIIEMALEMDVEYLELANTQYYGWGLVNRAQLMPTREQLQRAEAVVNEYRARIGNKDAHPVRRARLFRGAAQGLHERLGLGVPRHRAGRQRPALPCGAHAAWHRFPNVRDYSLKDIWYASGAFNRYRGDAWMKWPCNSCPEKHKDFGGCRCQAYALTGDAEAADPVCSKSPHHGEVQAVVLHARARPVQEQPIVFRSDANSRRLTSAVPTSTDPASSMRPAEKSHTSP